jgi:hypothetical protein
MRPLQAFSLVLSLALAGLPNAAAPQNRTGPAPETIIIADASTVEPIAAVEESVSFDMFGAVADFDPDLRTGTDNSTAWATFLEYISENRVKGVIASGNYYIATAPGSVVDPETHNVPEVTYDFIDIEAKEGTVLFTNTAPTEERSGTIVSRPILKAASSEGGTFRLTGNPIVDGGIVEDADLDGSLGSGSFPSVASSIEVRGYDSVEIEATFRHFAQNWDTRTPDNGNGWRRGPLLVWGNDHVRADVSLHAPTRREGPAFGNNREADVSISFKGNPDLHGEGNVSSPFNFVSGSSDIDVGGHNLDIRIKDWEGAWSGSAINVYSPGDITIDLNGEHIRGGNDGTNTATGAKTSQAGGGVFGKGIDIGDEVAAGPTRSVTIKNGAILDAFHYSLLLNRSDGTNIRKLVLEDVSLKGGWRGLITRFVDDISGTLRCENFLQYDPSDKRMGIAVNIEDVQSGNLTVHIANQKEAYYEAPNLDAPISDGRRHDQTGIRIRRAGEAFSLLEVQE